MYMYRLEVQTDVEAIADTIVVISETDEQAFQYAEDIFERHHFVKPTHKPIVLLEKIRVQLRSGYYIHHQS
jgi:hypothetical protein